MHNFRFPGNVVTGTPLDTQGMFGGWTVPWGSIALPCTPDTHTHIFKNADIEKASQLFKTLKGQWTQHQAFCRKLLRKKVSAYVTIF